MQIKTGSKYAAVYEAVRAGWMESVTDYTEIDGEWEIKGGDRITQDGVMKFNPDNPRSVFRARRLEQALNGAKKK